MITQSDYYRVNVSEPKRGNVFPVRYITPLRVEAHLGGYRFTLTQDFSVTFCFDEQTKRIIDPREYGTLDYREVTLTARQGFDTDLISSPRMLWSFIPPIGKGIHGSVIHDLLYRFDIKIGDYYLTRHDADSLFLYCLRLTGAGLIKRNLMYTALRFAGHRAWETNRR